MKIFNRIPRKALCLITSAAVTGIGIYLGKETDFFSSVCVCGAVYTLINYVAARDQKRDKASVILGAVLSALYIIAEHYTEEGGFTPLFTGKHEPALSVARFIFLIPLFYFCLRGILIFLREHKGGMAVQRDKEKPKRRVFFIPFFMILTVWFVWTLANYPGTVAVDTEWQLRQFFGNMPLTGHHPPFSTYLIGFLMYIGIAMKDASFGMWLYLFLQSVFGAFVFATGIKKLYVYGLRIRYLAVITAFFAFVPIWGAYAQWYQKDLLYIEISVLFIIYLTELIIKKECTVTDTVRITVIAFFVCMLRNNGAYGIFPTMIAMIIYLRKNALKKMLVSFLILLCAYISVTKIFYPYVLHMESVSKSIMLALPLQQSARYVYFYADEVTDEEREAIDAVVSYDYMLSDYDPYNNTLMQATYRDDDSKLGAYFRVWWEMFKKHPGVYIDATLAYVHPLMAPVSKSLEGEVLTDIEPQYAYMSELGVHRVFDGRVASVFEFLRLTNIRLAVINILTMPGFYIWCVIVLAFVYLKTGRDGALISFIPAVMNTLAIAAGPAPALLRYTLPIAASLPFIIGTFATHTDKNCDGITAETAQ